MKEMKKLMSEDKAMDTDSKAKYDMLKALRREAMDMMKDDVADGMQKVTVAAPDKEGLEEGLEKAEELVEKSDLEKALMDEMSDESIDESDLEDEDEMDEDALLAEELEMYAEDDEEEEEEG